jgi:hypothetical protein
MGLSLSLERDHEGRIREVVGGGETILLWYI